MPFFDNLTKKVGDAAKTAAKKSGELVETTKLNMAINSEEDKIKAVYTEIGKAIYRKYKGGESIYNELVPSCQQIDSFEENIASLKEKIMQLKNVRVCPNCGQEVEMNIVFCPKCGANLGLPQSQPMPQYGTIPKAGPSEPQFVPQYNEVQPMQQSQTQSIPQYIPAAVPNNVEPAPQTAEATAMPQPIPVIGQKSCPSCGASVLPDGKFCPSCGTKL